MINQDAATSSRQRLLLAAMQLFAAKGYGSTSIADVLGLAQVNSGSLYHFFPGKQELLLAVLEEYRNGIDTMLLMPAWEDVEDPVQRIFALLARYRAALVQTECSYGCPIGSLALELHEPDPVVRTALAANFEAWITAIQKCLRDASDRLPRKIDIRSLAEFVLITMEGAVMQSRTYRDIAFFDRAVQHLQGYFGCLEHQRAASGQARKKAQQRNTPP